MASLKSVTTSNDKMYHLNQSQSTKTDDMQLQVISCITISLPDKLPQTLLILQFLLKKLWSWSSHVSWRGRRRVQANEQINVKLSAAR